MSKEIGFRLKQARKDNHIFQEDAARLMGMSRPTLSSIENGKRDVTAEEVKKFSELYHISVGQIINGEDDEVVSKLRSYEELFDQITKEYQEKMRQIIEKMKAGQ